MIIPNAIKALINVDMIGGMGLRLMYDLNSTQQLRDLVWRVARRRGYATHFPIEPKRRIGDDHIPFADIGIHAVNLIDVEYGPGNGFWHTNEDSPDKLSTHSFGMIADVLVGVLEALAP